MQCSAVSKKQISLIFQTTLLTFYRLLGGNVKDITAASAADFPSEKKP